MGADEPKPDDQELDLEDSIDALLDEVDASCAKAEGNETPAEGSREQATESDPPDPESAIEPEGSDDVVEAEDEMQPQQALDALESVSESAQTLIEDAIGDLLDDPPSEHPADQEQAAEPALESDVIDETTNDTPPTEHEASAEQEPAESSGEVASIEVIEEDTTNAPEDPDDESLLASVVEELSANAQESSEADPIADEHAAKEDESEIEADQDPSAETDESESSISPDVDSEPEPAEELDSANAPGTAPESGESLEDQLDEETDDAEAAAEESTQSSDDQSPSTVVESLENIDETLAGISDELLMGDFETAEGELIDATSLETADDSSALLDQLGLVDLEIVETIAEEESANETQSPASEPGPISDQQSSTPAQPSQQSSDASSTEDSGDTVSATAKLEGAVPSPKQVIAPKQPSLAPELGSDDEIHSIWVSSWIVIRSNGLKAWEIMRVKAGPLAARLILTTAKPVQSKPAIVRDSIGYLAIWTTLLASILWIYLVFIRTTPTPTPAQAPTRMLEPGEITDPAKLNNPEPMP